MATDTFLSKKSVLGLADRVVLSPPTIIEFTLVENTNSSSGIGVGNDQDFYTWALNAPEGGIAIGCCTSGGYKISAIDMFYCILQKGKNDYVFAFGVTLGDDGTSFHNIALVINTMNSRVNDFR